MLNRVRRISEQFHMAIHVGLSVLVIYLFGQINIQFNYQEIILLLLMSVLPDLEHLVFFSTYGRKTAYTLAAWDVFRREGFFSVCRYLAHNHKTSTSLYLHNIATPLLFVFLGIYLYFVDGMLLSAASFILSTHYLFDIGEDFLMMGKLNPNWFFRFHQPSNYKTKK